MASLMSSPLMQRLHDLRGSIPHMQGQVPGAPSASFPETLNRLQQPGGGQSGYERFQLPHYERFQLPHYEQMGAGQAQQGNAPHPALPSLIAALTGQQGEPQLANADYERFQLPHYEQTGAEQQQGGGGDIHYFGPGGGGVFQSEHLVGSHGHSYSAPRFRRPGLIQAIAGLGQQGQGGSGAVHPYQAV